MVVLPVEFPAHDDDVEVRAFAQAARLGENAFDGVKEPRAATRRRADRIQLVNDQHRFVRGPKIASVPCGAKSPEALRVLLAREECGLEFLGRRRLSCAIGELREFSCVA